MLLGLKTGVIFFISLYLQHVHCPLGSNVDECLHVDVCTHCRAVRDHYRPAFVCVCVCVWGGGGHLFVNSLVLFLSFYHSKSSLFQRYCKLVSVFSRCNAL